VTIDPELAAVLAALACGVIVGLPGLQRAMVRRRRALRECIACGRALVFGEPTCDCRDK
jgi:hypothetical protein